MIIRLFFIIVLMVSSVTVEAQQYSTKLLDNEEQIDKIISSLTLEEKVEMLHGKNMFSSAGIPRLGIADVEYAERGPIVEWYACCGLYARLSG